MGKSADRVGSVFSTGFVERNDVFRRDVCLKVVRGCEYVPASHGEEIDPALYFFFDVTDSNIVIFPDTDEGSVARGDRVEMFFSADPDMKEYYCLEIDPSGKVLDYKASFYRDFDRDWDLRGLQTSGRITDKGYSVEVAIPVEWYRQTEISSMRQGTRIIAGIYRGEFSRTRDGRIDQSWISWQDPRTDKPDFHIPSALGFFTLD